MTKNDRRAKYTGPADDFTVTKKDPKAKTWEQLKREHEERQRLEGAADSRKNPD